MPLVATYKPLIKGVLLDSGTKIYFRVSESKHFPTKLLHWHLSIISIQISELY